MPKARIRTARGRNHLIAQCCILARTVSTTFEETALFCPGGNHCGPLRATAVSRWPSGHGDRPLGRLRQGLAKPQRRHGRVTAAGNLTGTFSSVGVIVRLLPALVEILFCHVLKPAFSRLTI